MLFGDLNRVVELGHGLGDDERGECVVEQVNCTFTHIVAALCCFGVRNINLNLIKMK